MKGKCPNCKKGLLPNSVILLSLGFKARCHNCQSKLWKSVIWTFVLSCVSVIVLLASLAIFVNLLGFFGFVITAIIFIATFLIGQFYLPVDYELQ